MTNSYFCSNALTFWTLDLIDILCLVKKNQSNKNRHLSHPELYILVISFTDIIGSKSWFWITRVKNITSSYDAHTVS